MSRGNYITGAKMRRALEQEGLDVDRAAAVLGIAPRYLDDTRRWDRLLDLQQAMLAGTLAEEQDEPEQEPGGVLRAAEDLRPVLPAGRKTLVFTSAQSNTLLNDEFWLNLLAYCEHKGAELHISRFTYNKSNQGRRSIKPGSSPDTDDLWFDPRIAPYVSDEQIEITPDLIWCGELNVLPTRVDPVSGFEAYGRGASCIIPHAKLAMRSLPRMKHTTPRFLYTTGAVTMRNYIERAAGQKASLHHVYGALVVEVDEQDNWWARQLNQDTNHQLFDIDCVFEGGELISDEAEVASITHGDLHGFKADPEIVRAAVDLVIKLRPDWNVFHDCIDFMPRNHHNIKDPWHLADVQEYRVKEEFRYAAGIMADIARIGKIAVVTSNHDKAIDQWLKNPAGFQDGANSAFWAYNNWRRLTEGPDFKPFRHNIELALVHEEAGPYSQVVNEDESLVIAGVEHGLHGHLGPNGARGSPRNLRFVGKANTAHTHSPSIFEGVYTAGAYALEMGYNIGPTSWAIACVVTFTNGKRQVLVHRDGKFHR